jgi:hypothetical protein
MESIGIHNHIMEENTEIITQRKGSHLLNCVVVVFVVPCLYLVCFPTTTALPEDAT